MTVLEALKDIHRRCAFVQQPNGLEIHAILLHDLMPILEENKSLLKIWNADSSKHVRLLLEDESYRLFWLNNPNPVHLGAKKTEVDSLCKILIAAAQKLPQAETGLKKVGRPSKLKYNRKENIIQFGEKLCEIVGNSKMARLCQKLLNDTVEIGESFSWEEIYEYVYEVQMPPISGWKNLDQINRKLSAKLNAKGIPPCIEFHGGQDGKLTRVR